MSAALRAGVLLLLACSAAAQDRPVPVAVPSLPTMRITVTLVQVDAVVTDSQGRHIANLGPQDFEVLQDGQPQKVTYFSYIPEPPPSPVEPKIKNKDDKVPLGPPAPITPGQVKRTVALVVDDLALSFQNLSRVRDSLRKYVETQMQPGDLVALVRTGGGVAILEQFTTDKRILLEGIDLLKWRFQGRSGLIPIDPVSGREDADVPRGRPQMLDYGYALSALGTLHTLEEVVNGMRSLPGRKSIVLLSDSLQVDPEIAEGIEHLTDLSNRAGVSIYAIDPRGLQTDMPNITEGGVPQTQGRNSRNNRRTPAGRDADPSAQDGAEPPEVFNPFPPGAMEIRSMSGLSDLASRTGGLFYANRNDIPDLIRRATDDQLGYYLLGYTPAEGTFEAERANAKFHKIVVRVHTKGLRVRWKSGFTGVPDELTLTETADAPKTREQQLMEALASPFGATGIKVRLTSIFAEAKNGGPFVHSMLHFDGKDLNFIKDDKGLYHATVDIVTTAYRGIKKPMEQRIRVQELNLTEEMYPLAMKDGFMLTLDDLMKEPGTFLMRVVVRDRTSERIGSASQFVSVPDTRKGKFAMSGIVVTLATADMLRNSGVEVPPTGQTQEGKVEAWTEGGPAMRRYRPGQMMVYGFVVLHPKLSGSEKEPKVISQLQLFRDGKLVFTGPAAKTVSRSAVDPTNFVGGGVLRFGPKMPPGEYLMQITVTDELGKKKTSHASQWMDFEVVGDRKVETSQLPK